VPALKAHHQRHARRADDVVSYVASALPVGVEVLLRYREGVLVRALVRGAGDAGADVTDNVRTMPSAPLRLRPAGSTTESRATKPSQQGLGPSTLTPTPPFPAELDVVGRVVLRSADLAALDRARVDAGEPPFVNAEAAVRALLVSPDPRRTASRPLELLATEVLTPTGLESAWQMLGALKSWGFAVVPLTWRCKGLQEVLDFVGALQQAAPSIDLPLDGGVLTTNRFGRPESTDAPPRAVRLVFPPGGRPAVVERVYQAVSRSGAILPVAQIGRPRDGLPVPDRAPVPAHADGLLALTPGQAVRVRPGGVAPVLSVEAPRAEAPDASAVCSACPAPPEARPGEAFRTCRAERCPGSARASLLHLVGPRGLRLASMTVEVVDALLAERGALDLPGLLSLPSEALEAHAPGQGASLEAELRAHRRLPLSKVLYLASIPHMSERSARIIAQEVFSVGRLVELEARDFARIRDVDPEAVAALEAWMAGRGPRFIAELREAGVEILDARQSFPAPFVGLRVVVDGRFSTSALHIVDEVERLGGRVEARVGRITDLAILGARAERTRDSAAMYGVPVLGEPEWSRLSAGLPG
jgi:DNA ligase (NAD+)